MEAIQERNPKLKIIYLVFSLAFFALTIVATIYCVITFSASMMVISEGGWSVFALMATIPLFFLSGLAVIGAGGISLIFSIVLAAQFKIKNAIMYVYIGIIAILMHFPIIALMILVSPGSASTTSSIISESQAIIRLML